MEANGVNYYKGVLLCSRPNESPSVQKQKQMSDNTRPFCGRVTPYDPLGLLPSKKLDQHQTRRRNLPVLGNHKRWLESFKKKIAETKQTEQQEKIKEQQRLEKIKMEGVKRREEFKNSINETGENSAAKLKENASAGQEQIYVEKKRQAKKGQKPGWAKTEKQREDEEEKEVDELLDFFEHEEVKDYLEDEEVNRMLRDLKQRIEAMKNEGKTDETAGNWKKKQMKKIEEANEKDKEKKNDDILSRISKNSEAQSVASQKTAERVQELEKKKQQKDWDNLHSVDKKSQASLDQQIAKNVADEVLRNYPALKHHSNQSIRKMLQKQAHQQIKS